MNKLFEEEFGELVKYETSNNTIYYKDKDLLDNIIEFIKKNKLTVNIQLSLF